MSPLAFWRRGRPRTYRERPPPKQTAGRLWRRFTGFYFPPWVPVVGIIIIVFGILGGVFFFRQAGARPNTRDHWHAQYEIFVCGVQQPVVPEFDVQEGVHTHGDGLIHIHPFIPAGEGRGARLVKWFEYGGDGLGTGGKLSDDTLHIPGDFQEYRNGDLCEGGESDGQPGVVQLFVNGERVNDVDDYLPRDGDVVRIVFAPEGQLPPGTLRATPTPEGEVAREIAIEAGDRGRPEADSFFNPNTFTIKTGETVKVEVTNTGSVSHNLRIASVDQEYETEDDFVTDPIIITPGDTGTLTARIDEAGTYPFRCDIHPQIQFGTVVVEESAPPGAEATPSP